MRDLPKHRWNASASSNSSHDTMSAAAATLPISTTTTSHHYPHNKLTTTNTASIGNNYRRILTLLSLVMLASILISSLSSHYNDYYDDTVLYRDRGVDPSRTITTTTSSTTTTTQSPTDYTNRRTDTSAATTTATTTTTSSSSWPPMDLIENLLLSTTSTPHHRRLVVAAANGPYADFATNFVHSLFRHEIRNVVLVPLDAAAYTILHERFPAHTVPVLPELLLSDSPVDTTSGGASFRSKAFEVLTSSRPIFLEHFLRQNLTIFYNDIDMVWQYNAWDTIDQLKLVTAPNNNKKNKKKNSKTTNFPNEYDVLLWKDGPVQICTCLLYMVPSPTSFSIIQEWKAEIQTHLYPNDQKAFLVMAQKHALLPSKRRHKAVTNIDPDSVQVFPNSDEFPTGAMYDWERQIRQVSSSSFANNNMSDWQPFVPASSSQRKSDPARAVIIHNNWIEGQTAKRQRFQQAQLWWVNE